jgi:dihydropteroate synthase
MQKNPHYENVMDDLRMFFLDKISDLKQSGVNDIIIDPGFGFGKTVEHNYEILNNLEYFKAFDLPLMVGVSRKSMINKMLGTKPEDALNGTTVANTIALLKGADILRVHDVKEAVEAVKIVNALK